MTKKNYSIEYKEEVCKRIEVGREKQSEVCRELGIKVGTLQSWLKRYRENSVKPFVGSGHIKPEDEELKRLQRENRDLREENEILKKAAAYFAKNQK